MENETNNKLTRQQRIENFLLDPDKEIFNSLEQFNEAVNYIKEILGNLDINELEKLQGADGKTPVLGVDFLTDEDLDKIEAFIQERVNISWSGYPTREEINLNIENKVKEEVSKIPRVKGDKGNPGKNGEDGSPDTAEQIIAKLRSLSKNQKLNVSDIRGLQNELNRIAQDSETSIEDLRKLVESFRITIPATSNSGGGITGINGLIEEGANISITGSGTLADPFVINAVGMGLGDVVGPAGATSGNIPEFDGVTGKIIKDSGKKVSDLQLALGYTAENVANKKTTLTDDSDTYYPTQKAVKTAVDAKEDVANKVTSISGSSTDTQYPSAKLVYDQLAGKQPTGSYEVTTNKSTTLDTDKASDTKYPSVKSAYDWATGLFQTLANKVISFQVTPDDSHYPSEKLVKDSLDAKAPLASPTFTGTVTTPAIKITTGAGLGKVLTSDADGDATWETPSSGGTSLWTAITGTRASNTTITVATDLTAIFKKGMIVRWQESGVDKVGMVSIPSTYSSPNTTITIIGDVCASIDASSFKYSSIIGAEQFIKNFAVAGNIGAVATDIANAYYATEPMRVIGADLQVGKAGTTNSTTIDINKAGTTMFTTKPTLATTVATSPTPFTADTTSALALGDRVSIDIDAIQTTNAIDLYVQLYLFPSRYLALS